MTGSVAAPPNVPGNLGNEGWFEWIRTHPNSPYTHPNEILRSPKRLPVQPQHDGERGRHDRRAGAGRA